RARGWRAADRISTRSGDAGAGNFPSIDGARAMNIRILLADDHALVRAGLRALINEMPGIQVVGEAENGSDALRLIAELQPDVALVDISMPQLNGLEVAARVSAEQRRTRVVMLSMHAFEEYVHRALVAGA